MFVRRLSTTRLSFLPGVRAIYCHATSKDGAQADPAGEVRAERLVKAADSAGVEHIVYNSSGIACGNYGKRYCGGLCNIFTRPPDIPTRCNVLRDECTYHSMLVLWLLILCLPCDLQPVCIFILMLSLICV